MGIYLNPGNDAFLEAIQSEIYVDKTGLIAYTNRVMGTVRKNICVSRPRRFGKSMAANMLCAYYSHGCCSAALFQGRKIHEDTSFTEHLNQYDVLFLNMQQFIRGARTPGNFVNYIEQKVLSEIKTLFPHLLHEQESSLPDALMSIYTKGEQGKPGFIIIIDEWDCIFREMKEDENSQKYYLYFLRDLLKDRPYVKLAYMTGILPIKKYGTHSALNIFEEFSMTDPKYLAPYTGFTEEEVKQLCLEYHMDFEEARQWYDGYRLDSHLHIYNPKSISDAMHNRKFKSYWTRTETYEALRVYIDMNFDGLKDAVIAMTCGERCEINPDKFQNDMTTFQSKDDVLTLLAHLGYLSYEESTRTVCIPNMEIAGEFRNAIEGSRGWEHLAKAIQHSEKLLDATLNQDEQAVAQGIDAVHTEHISLLSYNTETSLSCVISLAYFSAQKEYILIREFPSGKGFADIVFLPRKSSAKPAMIIELKWDKSATGAIAQIKNKGYVQALETYSGNILLVGINYSKKSKRHSCIIERYSPNNA